MDENKCETCACFFMDEWFVPNCRKDLPEPEYNEEEESYDCEGYEMFDPLEEEKKKEAWEERFR